MGEFWEALTDPQFSFLRNAFIMGLLSSFAFGTVGGFVVARRISYIAGAIAHAVLGGIGIALWLNRVHGLTFMTPLVGSLGAALAAAIFMGIMRRNEREREDSIIGAIWALGMGVGLLFLYATPGYTDPMGYLFGNIMLISRTDMIAVLVLDLVLLGIVGFYYDRLQSVCFDEEFAWLRGIRVDVFYTLLLCLVGLAVVLLVSITGVILVVALLTLPAAVAGNVSRTLWQMIWTGSALCALFVSSGIALSYEKDWPAGPSIIVVAAAGYVCALGLRTLYARLRPAS